MRKSRTRRLTQIIALLDSSPTTISFPNMDHNVGATFQPSSMEGEAWLRDIGSKTRASKCSIVIPIAAEWQETWASVARTKILQAQSPRTTRVEPRGREGVRVYSAV